MERQLGWFRGSGERRSEMLQTGVMAAAMEFIPDAETTRNRPLRLATLEDARRVWSQASLTPQK